jgi:hypothetical protein
MGALMELNQYSLLGALIFLILGIFEVMVLQRVLYPSLRWRYEKAKTTQSQGADPNRIMTLLRIQSLIFMPVLGLLLGGRMQKLFG